MMERYIKKVIVFSVLSAMILFSYFVTFAEYSFGASQSKFDFNESNDTVLSKVSINNYGDNLIHTPSLQHGIEINSFDFLYEHIKDNNSKYDITVMNHETPLVTDKNFYFSYPSFGTPYFLSDSVKNAGFDIVTFANNHVFDKWDMGIDCTLNQYKEKGIMVLGVQDRTEKPYKIINKNGIRICLFNYTYGINSTVERYSKSKYAINVLDDPARVITELYEGINSSDVSIVYVHWGEENTKVISRFQKEWANIFLNVGVDIVVGTHPHVLQKYEVVNNGEGKEMLIYYSLGNFISSQNNIENLVSGEATFDILKTNRGIKITNYNLNPVIVHSEWGGYTSACLVSTYDEEMLKRNKKGYKLENILQTFLAFTAK